MPIPRKIHDDNVEVRMTTVTVILHFSKYECPPLIVFSLIPYRSNPLIHSISLSYTTTMIESFATKTSLPPIPTSSPSVGPVPTVIPGPSAVLQEIHETGKRTLWCVIRVQFDTTRN